MVSTAITVSVILIAFWIEETAGTASSEKKEKKMQECVDMIKDLFFIQHPWISESSRATVELLL